MYTELEQFLGRGEEKAIWLLSMKNIMGLLAGGFVGHRLGTVLFEAGLIALLCAVVGAVIGITLTFQYHGLIIGRRLLISLRFFLRRAMRPHMIDAEAIFAVVEVEEVPIQIYTHDGTPVLVAQQEPPR